jgi:hypothetical protein
MFEGNDIESDFEYISNRYAAFENHIEDVLLGNEKEVKPSSLWCHYSMTKSMLNIKKVNVGLYLKWKSAGYKQNKSFIFFSHFESFFYQSINQKIGCPKIVQQQHHNA